jgi:hypothetical protein
MAPFFIFDLRVRSFGHPSPSKRQKLNATANAFGAPDVLRTCHFATTIVNSVLAS